MSAGFANRWRGSVRSLRDWVAGLRPGRIGSVILLWVLACSLPGFARQNDSPAIPAKPSVQVDLAPAEYMGLSRGARLSGAANVSLNFLDARHVLLTFNPKKLFTRQPDCPPSHDDRLMHVAVLEFPVEKWSSRRTGICMTRDAISGSWGREESCCDASTGFTRSMPALKKNSFSTLPRNCFGCRSHQVESRSSRKRKCPPH